MTSSNIKTYKPYTKSRRVISNVDYKKILTEKEPEKSFTFGKKKISGRSKGRVSIRHKGAGVKRLYRQIDFKQGKLDIEAKVKSIEYDPNRSAFISLIFFTDGEKRYILAPAKIKVGDKIIFSSKKTEINVGNRMPLKYITVGMLLTPYLAAKSLCSSTFTFITLTFSSLVSF